MASDWDEVKRLAADFQRAQLSTTIQRLSERNCVELITRLIDQKLLEVVFTIDGKEYVTPQQLEKEIKDELYVHGGRIDIVELSKLLSVDLSLISARVNYLERHSKHLKLVLGQLVDNNYLNRIASEINERLKQHGQISISELIRIYDLPSEFLVSFVEGRIGKTIFGRQDPNDHSVFYTESFVTRNKACFRGAIMATTCPISMANILSQSGVHERMFSSVVDSLIETKQFPGILTGNMTGNGLYVPKIYSKAQNDWVNNFYKQNGYLEYDALSRLGIGNPVSFVQRTFPDEKLFLLKSCAIGPQLIGHVEAAVEEATSSNLFADIMSHMPSMFEPEDCNKILNEVLKTQNSKNPVNNMHLFCDTYVVPNQFLQSLSNLFDSLIKKKAEECVTSGAYLSAQAENKMHGGKMGFDHEERDSKADRKEERRKKATGGKGGGGTQGRETKTKSTKKKYMRGKAGGDDFDSDDEPSSTNIKNKNTKNPSGKFEFLSVSEIRSTLETHEAFQDEECEELIEEIAKFLYPTLNKSALTVAQVVFESTLASTAQSRRKNHSELQEKLNALVTNVRLFEKGIKMFSDNELQQQTSKYLLKTLCTDIANDILSYIAQENMIQYDQSKDLTPEVRQKIINEVSNDIKDPLMKLHKALSGSSVDNFLSCLEGSIGPGLCDMILRKPDKKKERPQVYAHRQSLLEQLSMAQDPAVVLHVASLVLFQTITQTMLHASGRFVSHILAYLQPQLSVDMYNTLQHYHDMVLKLLKMSENDPERSSVVTALQDGMVGIKEMANTFKRPSVSDKA